MQWTKPDFQVICLSMEVTAYVNTDDSLPPLEATFRAAEKSEQSVEHEAESFSAG